MIFEPYGTFVTTLFKAWQSGQSRIRKALLFAIFFVFIALIALASGSLFAQQKIAEVVASVFGACAAAIAISIFGYQSLLELNAKEEKIATVEERVREHPEKPQFAWDLARTKLESYLDRNLSQVRSIYWLTLFVMLCGFGLVLYGLLQAFQAPEKLPVSIVASSSGVIISFIGGSFLLIYRSILAQSKDYVMVLERINAVGMAVQVISNIPDDSAELKHQTTAELAKQLLSLYATVPAARPQKVKKQRRTEPAGSILKFKEPRNISVQ